MLTTTQCIPISPLRFSSSSDLAFCSLGPTGKRPLPDCLAAIQPSLFLFSFCDPAVLDYRNPRLFFLCLELLTLISRKSFPRRRRLPSPLTPAGCSPPKRVPFLIANFSHQQGWRSTMTASPPKQCWLSIDACIRSNPYSIGSTTNQPPLGFLSIASSRLRSRATFIFATTPLRTRMNLRNKCAPSTRPGSKSGPCTARG
jgi:hypothetical protein